MIIRKEVEGSSAIAAFEYDTDTLILQVQFTHGGVYDYPNIEESIVRDWMKADSKGRYFNQKIRCCGA